MAEEIKQAFGFTVIWDKNTLVPLVTKITEYKGKREGMHKWAGDPHGMTASYKIRNFFSTKEEACLFELESSVSCPRPDTERIVKLAAMVLHERGIIGNTELLASCIHVKLKELQNDLDALRDLAAREVEDV